MMTLGPRWDHAQRIDDDSIVDGSLLSPQEWRILQQTYRVGDLVMPCCHDAAIPKCSSNGTHFFAHAGGECTSAPESRWHVQAKEFVRDTARELGYRAQLEVPGGGNIPNRWCSDVWITTSANAVAVEVQHSYQHLRDYVRRQERYATAGVRCLWLVIEPHYGTLLKAMGKRRFQEFGRRWPDGQDGCIRHLPVGMLALEPTPHVRGPRLQVDLASVLDAFLTDRFRWENGAWLVDAADNGNIT